MHCCKINRKQKKQGAKKPTRSYSCRRKSCCSSLSSNLISCKKKKNKKKNKNLLLGYNIKIGAKVCE